LHDHEEQRNEDAAEDRTDHHAGPADADGAGAAPAAPGTGAAGAASVALNATPGRILCRPSTITL
jgi:hypothetical protein